MPYDVNKSITISQSDGQVLARLMREHDVVLLSRHGMTIAAVSEDVQTAGQLAMEEVTGDFAQGTCPEWLREYDCTLRHIPGI